REYSVVEHQPRRHHAGGPIPDDCAGPGDRRLDDRKESRRAWLGHLPHQRSAVHPALGLGDSDRRSSHLLPGGELGADRGAFRRLRGKGVLMATAKALSLFDPIILKQAAADSFRKLAPQHVSKNPVMFVVEVGSLLTTIVFVRDLFQANPAAPRWFTGLIAIWLWFTVVFANFAEAVAEGRGKAQADTLRKMRRTAEARKVVDGKEQRVPADSLRKGDIAVAEAGDVIPGDGEVIEGV